MSVEADKSNITSSTSSVRKKRQNFKFGNNESAEVDQDTTNKSAYKSIEVLIDR